MATSVRVKIIGLAVGTLIVTISLYVLVNSLLFSREYTQVLEFESQFVARLLDIQLQELFGYGLSLETIQGFEEQTRQVVDEYDDVTYAYIQDRNGTILFPSDDAFGAVLGQVAPAADADAPGGTEERIEVSTIGGADYLEAVRPVMLDDRLVGFIHVGIPLEIGRAMTMHLLRQLIQVGLVLLVLATLLVVLLSTRWVTRPLGRLMGFVEEVRLEQDLSRRLEISYDDEVGRLGLAFNALLTALEETRAELDAYTEQLEAKVARRTASLADSNAQLQKDIHKRQQIEASLRKHLLVMDAASEGMAITGRDQSVIYANSAMAQIFGFADGTALFGLAWPEVFRFKEFPDGFVLAGQIHESLQTNHTTWSAELAHARPDTTTLYLGISVTATEHGEWGWIIRDLTDRKQVEAAILQSQKLESVGRLAGGVAHDFNNLLTAILGQATLARMKLPEESPALPHLDRAELSIERAADLTRQLLAFAGKGQFQVATIDLNQIIRDSTVLAQAAVPSTADLVLDLTDQELLIEADVGQLQQLFMNLIVNAAEAIEDRRDGQITVRTMLVDPSTPPSVPVATKLMTDGATLPPGHYAAMTLTDNGYGMDDEQLSMLFDPFYTTKGAGRGLGLAASLGIVHAFGGRMSVTSKLQQGAEFCVLLPCHRQGEEEMTIFEDEAAHGSATATAQDDAPALILLVDDEEVVRAAIADILDVAGYRTQTAVDGYDGLQKLDTLRSEVQLVLLDVVMPGIDGNEVYRRIRQNDTALPIIMSSGYSADQIDPGVADDPNAFFLKKPYSIGDLIDMIAQMLAQQ